MRHIGLFLALTVLPRIVTGQSDGAPAAQPRADVEITHHIFKPAELPPDLSRLHEPEGFRIQRFATNAGNARVLAIGPDGSVYVTRRDEADVLMFRVGADGLASGAPKRVAGRAGIHGITFVNRTVYLATVHEVFKAEVQADGSFGPLEMIIHDLPDAGQHNTRMIQVGPDGMLYIAIGSTCNECAEPNPENATILRATPDGKSRSVFASGLRDTIGFGWHPQTGELWGMDHGIDALGDDQQPEELNHLERGKRYGWPYFFGANQANPHQDPPGGLDKAELAKVSVPMVLGYTAHAAPMQMAFCNGCQFPQEYQGDAFISFRGSWNRKPASGYEVARIHFEKGTPVSIKPFVSGFLTANGESGRPVGAAIARDGSLLFTDDRNGVIYRVSNLSGTAARGGQATAPSEPMLRQNRTGQKSTLAIQELQASQAGKLQVSSTFAAGEKIPVQYSAYGQNASPPLRWSAPSGNAKSFALLVEDPDAKTTPLPVVHWVAWNIPGGATGLPEGLPGLDRLRNPDGMRQGANSMGVIGYKGPRPPEGDPPHHYHFQVFALDQSLDLRPGTTRDELIQAMRGHIVAAGQLIGLFQNTGQLPKK
jgi:Raf kinase inhibitor-like YbhB/YbcL family protein